MIPEWLARRWCIYWHRRITLPYMGSYECLSCLRKYPSNF